MLVMLLCAISAAGRDAIGCNNCIYLYMNLTNCVNCNAKLPTIYDGVRSLNDLDVYFVLEELYKGKGAYLLSEMLHRNVLENEVFYNDSIIEKMVHEVDSNAALLYFNDSYSAVFDVSNIDDTKFIHNAISSQLVRASEYLGSESLSNQLYLTILGSDTFVVDLVLSKIFKNRELFLKDLFVWDIPGLVNADLVGIDSLSSIYRVQFDNIKLIQEKYLIFCTANQFVEGEHGIDVYPRLVILMLGNDASSENKSIKSFILIENGNCYLDDYSILTINSNDYMISECGKDGLDPRLRLIDVVDDSIMIRKSNKIRLNKRYKSSKGYTTDLGGDILYFIFSNKIHVVSNNGKLIELFDFAIKLKEGEYIISATSHASEYNMILLYNDNQYRLINGLGDLQSGLKSVIPYIIYFDTKVCQRNISNCYYDKTRSKMLFIDSSGRLVEVMLL